MMCHEDLMGPSPLHKESGPPRIAVKRKHAGNTLASGVPVWAKLDCSQNCSIFYKSLK